MDILEEKFVFTVDIFKSEPFFYIPLNGCSVDGVEEFPHSALYNVPYDWIIDWGDSSIEIFSGISSTDDIHIKHEFSTEENKSYQITIRPNKDDYGWMRAWGFSLKNDENTARKTADLVKSFDYITNKSFMKSETSYGDYYMAFMCMNTGITITANEVQTVSEKNIQHIANSFRFYQYANCMNLEHPAEEVFGPNVTSIGHNFRGWQYSGCKNLSGSTSISNKIDNIVDVGHGYRSSQFWGCIRYSYVWLNSIANMKKFTY